VNDAERFQHVLEELRALLIDLRMTGGQDGTRYAATMTTRLSYLAGGLAGADFRPTDQQLEVAKLLGEAVRSSVARFDALASKDLAAFNELLRSKKIGPIIGT